MRPQRRRTAPTWALSSPTDGSCAGRCSKRCRWSTCTSPCCPDGGVPPRSSGHSSPATMPPGVAVMGVEEGLDTGPVYAEVAVPIAPTSTAAELRAELSARGAELLIDTLGSGLTDPRPQSGTTTYAKKITNDDLELRFDEATGIELDRRVRVGGAWTTLRGERLKVWRAAIVAPSARRDTTARRARRRCRRHRLRGPAPGRSAAGRSGPPGRHRVPARPAPRAGGAPRWLNDALPTELPTARRWRTGYRAWPPVAWRSSCSPASRMTARGPTWSCPGPSTAATWATPIGAWSPS
jgi:hypothetical protein